MDLLLYLALVPALGVLSQWIAWRTRLPGILLLLCMGILLGQFVPLDTLIAEIMDGDPQDVPGILFPIVSLSVAVILFEGGLSLKINEFRQSSKSVVRLLVVGSTITMLLTAVAAYFILGFDLRVSLLLGAILIVTGPTVVGPLLRQIRPSARVSSVLKWEGIVIDPVGALLAVLVFDELFLGADEFSVVSGLVLLAKTIGVGLLFGSFGAWFLVLSIRRYWLPDHLQGVLSLALALLLFAISNALAEESGLVTVTLLGILLANQKRVAIEHIIEFKEHLQVLLIGCLFIVLGSRLDLQAIGNIGWPGVAFVLALVLVIRPLSVFVATLGTRLTMAERTFVAFVAPRGIVAAAVASVFALKLQLMNSDPLAAGATALDSVTFLVIVGTVFIYGLSAAPLARWLKIAEPTPQGLLILGADPWIRALARALHAKNVKVLLCDTNYSKISLARVDGLQAECVNIVSDHALENLDFSGLGRLLAMTPNDEVNALAVQQFRNVFGSENTFQLTSKNNKQNSPRALSHHLRGRSLFNSELTSAYMQQRIDDGAVFKTNKLTETFSLDSLMSTYGEHAVLLFKIDAAGMVSINTDEKPLQPKTGDMVISLVNAQSDANSNSVPA
ncbi:K(+)/H(+) antiporter NhaP2 [Rosistilla ulvae]|uniref:K(+)/H(+) antiporter NhaP2 n=1 Tax=Rosistilla ulvae TaxID=1930277 RepID=A0A517LXC9_9BACT|nr:sodium:proton antiporter [Rosistilla ulvae]QDS87284.1 K(+)/H(+) antiporter NhaP2 [Rosistilla ulvae]